MCRGRRLWSAALAVLFVSGLTATAVVQAQEVNDVKYSYYGTGGKQFWIPVQRSSARSANYGPGTPATEDFIEDGAVDPLLTLCGHARYFPLIAGDPASAPTVFMDAWVEYQITAADLPADIDLTTPATWYFWTRCWQPTADDKDSDWLVVNGDAGDLNYASPTEQQWLAADQASVRADDRVCNDLKNLAAQWQWIGYQSQERRPKTVGYVDGKFTFRIYEAEAAPTNARIDIICWANNTSYVPTDLDYKNAQIPGVCSRQHNATGFTPTSNDNAHDTELTISGTDLDVVSSVELVREGGGANPLVGAISSQSATQIVATFTTAGAMWGTYHLVTDQPSPCLSKEMGEPVFTLACSNPTVFTAVEPSEVLNPPSGIFQTLRISGTNVTVLAQPGNALWLKYANRHMDPDLDIPAQNLRVDGDDLLADFDITNCSRDGGAPAGPYYIDAARVATECSNPAPLMDAFWIRKDPPLGACNWQPWAAAWSNVNKGTAVSPVVPPQICANAGDCNNYNPTNWDYDFGQTTVLNTPKDVPTGGGLKAMHFFWDNQPPDTTSSKAGSGGMYQQIYVTPGVPIQYSYWWKGAATTGANIWFELILLDGPWNLYYADGLQETLEGRNNPYMVRKKTLPGGGTFGWTQVTDQDPPDPGSFGDRPQTITPQHDIVTVVMKCGRAEGGGLEVFFDNIDVHQADGPNLVVNGGFENAVQFDPCNNELLYQDKCEQDFWRRSLDTPPPPCDSDPFADVDQDGDVDQVDFAYFQACFSGPDVRPPEECACMDYNDPVSGKNDRIDQADLLAFEDCASGPGIPANPACDD